MKKLNNKGFSLVELIIVIAIMVVLVAVIAPQYLKFVNNSKVSTDVQTASDLATTVDAAVANNEKPFGTSTSLTAGPGGTLTVGDVDFSKVVSKLDGSKNFTINGDDTVGVTKITLQDKEIYPNPDVSPNGYNSTFKK